MLPEMDGFLVSRFPVLYRDRYAPREDTCMCWGFDCADGWARIVYDASRKLEDLSRLTGYRVVADQVKEKFGTLRIYVHVEDAEGNSAGRLRIDFLDTGASLALPRDHGDRSVDLRAVSDIAEAIVDRAGYLSSRTCEDCGNRETAVLRRGGWIRTLCDACEKKRSVPAAEPETEEE